MATVGSYAQVGIIVSNTAKQILSKYQHRPVHIVMQLHSVPGQNFRLHIFDKYVVFNNFSLKLVPVFTLAATMKPATQCNKIPSFFKIKILHDWELQN
jgi:hypothetical protein